MSSLSVCPATPGHRPAEDERAGSDDDFMIVPAEEGSRSRQGKRGRRGYSELLGQDGALAFAVLIGKSGGRWWPELQGHAEACRGALAQVSRALGDRAGQQPPTDTAIVGVAVVRAWRCVRSAASHQDTYALMQASMAHHPRRSGERYLEHEVLASARVEVSDRSVLVIAPELARLPSVVLGQRLCQRLSAAGAHLVVSKGARIGAIVAIDGLRSEWASDYGILSSASVAWPVAFPLARAMAAGVWYGDVSVKHRRQLPTEVTMAPLAPPAGLLRHWLLAVQDRPKPPEKARGENDLVYDKVSGCVRRFHPEHIIATLRAGQYVQNKAKVSDTLVNSHRFWYPRKRRFPPGQPVDRKVPHADTQRRNVVRIDSASMLARRA